MRSDALIKGTLRDTTAGLIDVPGLAMNRHCAAGLAAVTTAAASITAGNASGSNDGAAALVVASDALGLPALACVRAWTSVGSTPPARGGIGVAAMCAGGGMGSAAVIEVPAP